MVWAIDSWTMVPFDAYRYFYNSFWQLSIGSGFHLTTIDTRFFRNWLQFRYFIWNYWYFYKSIRQLEILLRFSKTVIDTFTIPFETYRYFYDSIWQLSIPDSIWQLSLSIFQNKRDLSELLLSFLIAFDCFIFSFLLLLLLIKHNFRWLNDDNNNNERTWRKYFPWIYLLPPPDLLFECSDQSIQHSTENSMIQTRFPDFPAKHTVKWTQNSIAFSLNKQNNNNFNDNIVIIKTNNTKFFLLS